MTSSWYRAMAVWRARHTRAPRAVRRGELRPCGELVTRGGCGAVSYVDVTSSPQVRAWHELRICPHATRALVQPACASRQPTVTAVRLRHKRGQCCDMVSYDALRQRRDHLQITLAHRRQTATVAILAMRPARAALHLAADTYDRADDASTVLRGRPYTRAAHGAANVIGRRRVTGPARHTVRTYLDNVANNAELEVARRQSVRDQRLREVQTTFGRVAETRRRMREMEQDAMSSLVSLSQSQSGGCLITPFDAPLGGDEGSIDLAAESDSDDDDGDENAEHAGADYAGGDSDEIEYELVIGPMTALTGRLANWGTKVSLQLQPQKRGSFTVYQNIHVQIGRDSYEYSEAWSLNSTKSQRDLFSIPPGILRESTYECHADTWIEEGGIDPTYDKDGEPYDVKSPWGTAAGRWELRRPPEGAKVTTRTTRLHWRDGVLQAPFELRLTKRQPAAEQVWVPKPTWSPGTWVEKRVAVSRLGSSRRKIRRTSFGPDRALTTNVDGLD